MSNQGSGAKTRIMSDYIILAEKKSRKELLDSLLKEIFERVLRQAEQGENPFLEIPERSKNTIVYDEKRDLILLKKLLYRRDFLNLKNVRKFTQTLAIASTIVELLRRGIHAQLRDVFYTRAYIFNSQRESDDIIEDLAAMTGVYRESLGVIASAKGVCVGDIRIRDRGDLIDCSRLGTGGWSITPLVEEVEFIDVNAEFVLVVEKDAAFFRLVEDKFWKKHKCILITGKGQADIATRRFVKRLRDELDLPVFMLVDSDPYGFYIASVYKRGSITLSFDSLRLATRDAKLLGLLPSDLDKYEIPKYARLKMTEADVKRLLEIRKYAWFQDERYQKEFELMLKRGEKAEVQALCSKDITYLSDTYVPRKLEEEDWLE